MGSNDIDSVADDQLAIKIVLLGDGAVGKTSLRRRYMGDTFETDYLITLGADFALATVEINNQPMTFQIWDLSGQQRFEFIRGLYYKHTQGALIVFDVTRPQSFLNCQTWISELIKNNDEQICPIIVIGNKTDLTESRKITHQKGKEFAAHITHTIQKGLGFDVPYVETSALTGENVDNAFQELGTRVLAYVQQQEERRLKAEETTKKESSEDNSF